MSLTVDKFMKTLISQSALFMTSCGMLPVVLSVERICKTAITVSHEISTVSTT